MLRDLGNGEFGSISVNPTEESGVSTLASVNATIGPLLCDWASTLTFHATGTWVAQFRVQVSLDGVNFLDRPMTAGGAPGGSVSTTGTANVYSVDVTGVKYVKIVQFSYTSGSADVYWTLSAGQSTVGITTGFVSVGQNTGFGITSGSPAWLVAHRPASLVVAGTAAAGTGVTITLPAAGASLYHCITSLRIQRFAAAVLTAAATPTLVTTTNLNSLQWVVPADAAALGTVYDLEPRLQAPLKTAVANTATTIVCPATTGVIWQVNAAYFTAS